MRAPRNNQAKAQGGAHADGKRGPTVVERLVGGLLDTATRPFFDEYLQVCSALEPQWFGRLRALPAFQALVAARVPEVALLRALAWVRFHSGFKTLRTHTIEFENAVTQLGAAAAALERLPNPPATTPGVHLPVSAAASQALAAFFPDLTPTGGLIINPDILPPVQFVAFAFADWLLRPKPLAGALRTLASNYKRLTALKPAGPVEDSAKGIFLRLIPALVKRASERPHHREVAKIYAFIFDLPKAPSVSSWARTIRKV